LITRKFLVISIYSTIGMGKTQHHDSEDKLRYRDVEFCEIRTTKLIANALLKKELELHF
jgi:hypothetical protein